MFFVVLHFFFFEENFRRSKLKGREGDVLNFNSKFFFVVVSFWTLLKISCVEKLICLLFLYLVVFQCSKKRNSKKKFFVLLIEFKKNLVGLGPIQIIKEFWCMIQFVRTELIFWKTFKNEIEDMVIALACSRFDDTNFFQQVVRDLTAVRRTSTIEKYFEILSESRWVVVAERFGISKCFFLCVGAAIKNKKTAVFYNQIFYVFNKKSRSARWFFHFFDISHTKFLCFL